MKPVRHLRISLFILIITIGLGTLGYALIEGWHPFDALYMTVITLATVGFREVHPLSGHGRVFTVLLIIFGAGTIAYAISSLLQFMVEGQLQTILGRKKLAKQIDKLQNHYIICGYGRIGALVSSEFRARPVPFVVVERDPELCQSLSDEGIPFVQGDATDDEALIEAGIQRARGLITAVDSETANVYITLTARGLNPDLFILARCGEEGTEKKLIRAGASKVISPYKIGANRMAWAMLRPSVVDFIDIAVGNQNLELQLEEIRVAPGSTLVDKTLVSSGIRRDWGIMIIAIKKNSGQMAFNPESTTPIEAEDVLITIGERPAIQKLEQIAAGVDAVSNRLHVHVPCGRLEELLPLLLEQRLQPEIAFKWFDLDRSPAEVNRWGRQLADAGLAVTVHAPFMDLNPGAIDPLIRDVTRRRFDRTLQLAGLLNAHLIVFHPGFFRWHYGGRNELWIEASLRFWPDFIAQAAAQNCRLVLENIFEEKPDTLQSLLNEIDSPWLGHCFDIGHWHLFGQGSMEEWFDALGRHLHHLHLHDNRGDRDAHLAAGEGSADFAGLFDLLDRHDLSPSATLEIHNQKSLLDSLPAIAPRFRG